MKTIKFFKKEMFSYSFKILKKIILIALFLICFYTNNLAQTNEFSNKLKGFDQYIEKILKEWNVPGAGVGIVYQDSLIYSKGFGYRDYEKKLLFTPNTIFPLASNTKLFTAISIGKLIEQNKLDWDKPIKKYVPTINFYNDELNRTITIRDMLSHRTGISRYDKVWYKSNLSRKEIFDKLRYLEPSQSLRQGFIYNNTMYAVACYIIEFLSSNTYEDYTKMNIFEPLEMKNTMFTFKGLGESSDYAVPYREKWDTSTLYKIYNVDKYWEGCQSLPSIISNIPDISHLLIALMNNGYYKRKNIISDKIIKATIEPSMAITNNLLVDNNYQEILNPIYGMARFTASYRGHFFTYHGGDMPGYHSQISIMPYDSIGVIVFIIGDQGNLLKDIISYNIYDRLLNLEPIPWSERRIKEWEEYKKQKKLGREKIGLNRILGTKPSHKLDDYEGIYENPAYGIISILLKDSILQFDFHNIILPLYHYHYERFDTPYDDLEGIFSVNFNTSPSGDISGLDIKLDQIQTEFYKKVEDKFNNPEYLSKYTGKYKFGLIFTTIELVNNLLFISTYSRPQYQLIPVKQNIFKIKDDENLKLRFIIENNKVIGFKRIEPIGEYYYEKLNN